MTNDLISRLNQHLEKFNPESFIAKYQCKYLVHWESYQYVQNAIAREKEIKKWRREKKEALIKELNPNLKFLNEEVGGFL